MSQVKQPKTYTDEEIKGEIEKMLEDIQSVMKEELKTIYQEKATRFKEWLMNEGFKMLKHWSEKAAKDFWLDSNTWLVAQLRAGGRKTLKNLFVAWLVINRDISTYRANKLAGGAGGYFHWLRVMRDYKK